MNRDWYVNFGWLLVLVLVGCTSGNATEIITEAAAEVAVDEATVVSEETAVPDEISEETAEPVETLEATQPTAPSAPTTVVEMTGPPAVEGPTTPVVVYTRKGEADREGSLWVWRPDHAPSLLADAGSEYRNVILSDDGEVAVFVRVTLEPVFSETASLWAVNTDGTNERLLLSAEDFAEMVLDPNAYGAIPDLMTMIPGTHSVLFSTRVLVERPGINSQTDLWRIDADTGWLSPLKEGNDQPWTGPQQEFVISPDGSQVALISKEGIEVMSTDGRTRTGNLLSYEAAPVSDFSQLATVGWTADNQTLLVALPAAIDPNVDDPPPTEMVRVAIDGSRVERLPDLAGASPFSVYFNQAGTAYAYIVIDRTQDQPAWEMRVMTEDGAHEEVVLGVQSMRFVGWDPDQVRYTVRVLDRTVPNAYIGQIGSDLIPLEHAIVNEEDYIHNSLRWVDDDRLVYVGYMPGVSRYALWVVTPGEQPVFISEIGGDWATFFPNIAIVLLWKAART